MSAKPRVLVCIDWYLPGFRGGGPIRSVANIVQALGTEFDFSILTSDTDYGCKEPYIGIEADTWVEMPGCKVWYCSKEARSYRHVRSLISQGDWDVLYLNSVFSLRYTIFPLWTGRAAFPDKKIVLAPRGMLHTGALALKPRKKKLFLRALRLAGLHKHVLFHATDAQEVQDIATVFGKEVNIHLAPNLPQLQGEAQPAIPKQPGELRMVFVSRISEKKGVLQLIEALRGQTAHIVLELHGPDEEPGYWERCEKAMAQLPAHVRVEKHPALAPSEIPALLGRHHVFAMPTRGENFGHAIFEAMAAGRPVLISDQTPWLDLQAEKAGMVLPVQDAAAWAAAIAKFAAMEQAEWAEWAAGARAYAEAHVREGDALAQTRGLFGPEENAS